MQLFICMTWVGHIISTQSEPSIPCIEWCYSCIHITTFFLKTIPFIFLNYEKPGHLQGEFTDSVILRQCKFCINCTYSRIYVHVWKKWLGIVTVQSHESCRDYELENWKRAWGTRTGIGLNSWKCTNLLANFDHLTLRDGMAHDGAVL